jgi:hypothetical protein
MAKIKDEQLQKLNEFKIKYEQLTFLIGKNKVEQKQLQIDEEGLFDEMQKLGEEEQSFLNELQKEYGDGNLDINTGEFTPKSSQ